MTLFPARADLSDPAQPQLVLSYLLDSARTAAELHAFSGIAPNAHFTISRNLLSENVTQTRDEIAVRDAAALNIVNDWLADPALEPVKPRLATSPPLPFVDQTAKQLKERGSLAHISPIIVLAGFYDPGISNSLPAIPHELIPANPKPSLFSDVSLHTIGSHFARSGAGV